MSAPNHRLSIAPMMDYTDRHCRYLLRLLAPHALLYTEMVTTGAILHGDRRHLLEFNPEEHPVALQLGGSDPQELAEAARIGASFGYDEINLNVGCPSDRVKQGRFGACLMAEPQRVADCVAAMRAAVATPVTVKSRIGIDDMDSYPAFHNFVKTVASAGCETFIVHARKAWLQGLSPAENRSIPPLRYDVVYQLKRDFPELVISINGGITTPEQALEHLHHVDGVMVGRMAIHDAYTVARLEKALFPDPSPMPSRYEIAERYAEYAQRVHSSGQARVISLTRHLLSLFQGQPGARRWRQALSTESSRPDASPALIFDALNTIRRATLPAA